MYRENNDFFVGIFILSDFIDGVFWVLWILNKVCKGRKGVEKERL